MITRMLLAATLLAWSATAVVADDAPPVETTEKAKTEAGKTTEKAESDAEMQAEKAKAEDTEKMEKAADAKAAGMEKADAAKSKPMPAQAQAAGKQAMSGAAPSLAQLAVCTDVEDRAPIGEAKQFPSNVGELWCFTQVMNAEAPTQIFHRWYVGDRMVNEIPINVGSQAWRCWSTKTILPSWAGKCHVEVVTESGDILGTQEFTLMASADQPVTTPTTGHTDAPMPAADGAGDAGEKMAPKDGAVEKGATTEKKDG